MAGLQLGEDGLEVAVADLKLSSPVCELTGVQD